ncbi:CaiB/BaiF CoA-transferase family protein [Oceaniovalibus sp. ACAM 378]|uniref:CaiB/BaiF CoA transferase family protein n=1 Tax=Oceaniovalibus sp. ACAM 378 TaxID=2599923 RepID=UPI001652AA76|nr:CoA transferase [Oceaniovalibus sp. ACAM 378]
MTQVPHLPSEPHDAAGARPLDGVTILDFTHVLAGPYATGQLALMGARVIRIERPGGDDFVRGHGGTDTMKAAGLGASFLSQNAGKQSIVLDLKTDAGRDTALRLATTADVLVQNFRPGVIDRLGLGFDAVRAVNPDIIHAGLSGFGPTGPLAGRPAYDHILQGFCGLMAMTGDEGSGPQRVGLPIVDYVAGQAMVAAVLAALLRRARQPDRAQELHVSMLDAMTGFMGAYAVNHQTTGALRGLDGNRAFSDSPYAGRFDCAGGERIVITANTPAQATRLCAALNAPDLADEPDPQKVTARLSSIFATAPAAHWDDLLAGANVPAGPVLSLAQCLAHPQMAGSPGWLDLPVPELGITVRVPGLPFAAPWAPTQLDAAPTFGRDTDAILQETPT